jgi:hypothetical protein
MTQAEAIPRIIIIIITIKIIIVKSRLLAIIYFGTGNNNDMKMGKLQLYHP